jgi:CDP-diacylglycerol--glycerol-3-phosphate 3-phosphatidyltransferase
MLNPPNSLSLLRAPLALLFLSESIVVRTIAVFCAMLTDCIDGYLARRYQYTSRLGAVLDPMMDKFFVFFVLGAFVFEQRLQFWQATLMISRDIFLCIFAFYLALKGDWKSYRCRAVRWGKVTTAMQFIIIILLSFNVFPPSFVYWIFFLVGLLVFIELIRRSRHFVV